MKIKRQNGLDGGLPVGQKFLLGGIFLLLTAILGLCLIELLPLGETMQRYTFAVGFAALVAGLAVGVMYSLLPAARFGEPKRSAAFYPLLAGALALVCMGLAYIWMGVWPFGIESLMIVDMHHQYGPLLAQLREMIHTGGSPLYSFETGIGANFISLFAYYLASPFNLILALLPETLLTEGVLIITLLKNAISAITFAACAQYLFRRRDISVVMLALGYSLSMYMIAYSWNIMWLDGVMMLPLAVLGFERMMREGKYGTYILSLAYILFTNYYIGFMVCVFLVLYFVLFVVRQSRTAGEVGSAFLRFAVGSLIGGGLAMCILLPVVFALGYTSAAGETFPEAAANFQLFRVPAQQLFGMAPTIRSGNLPNIYSGILPVVLLSLLLTTKQIPLRRRLAFGGLVAVLWLSFTVNIFDLLWHGLHTPNDLPYRFSFLYVFAVLLAAGAVLPHIKDLTNKQIGGTLALIAGYVVLYEMFQAKEANVFIPVYVTLLLAAVYCGILLLATHKKLLGRAVYMVLCAVFVLEMTIHGGLALDALNANEYYTDRENYVANSEHAAASAAVDEMLALADKEAGGSFYRAELLPRRTCVDTALYHYRGLTSFSSSNYYHTTRLLGGMGYADNGVNSYLYHSFVPTADSLLGIQYLTLKTDVGSHPYLQKIGSKTTDGITYYIYRNRLALPLGYRVSQDMSGFKMQQYNPFGTLEEMLATMTEDTRPVYEFLRVDVAESDSGKGNAYNTTRFNLHQDAGTVWFEATVDAEGAYYAFIDCTAAKSASVLAYTPNGQLVQSWDASTGEPYIIDIGTLQAGSTFQVSVTAETAVTGNIYLARMNADVAEEKLTALAAGGLKVTTFKEQYIEGTVNADRNGTLFTSIPYDASWRVKVDGKAVETYPIGDLNEDGSKGAFLAFDITDGEHTVTFTFIPKGLTIGLLLSAISLVAFIILLIATRTRKQLPPAPETVASGAPAPKMPPIEAPEQELSDDVTLTDLLETDTPVPPMREFKPEDFQI